MVGAAPVARASPLNRGGEWGRWTGCGGATINLNCDVPESGRLLSGYSIVNAYSGKMLDDPAFSTSDGTLIQQFQLNGRPTSSGSFCRPDNLMVTGDRRSEGPGPQGPDREVRGIHLIGSD